MGPAPKLTWGIPQKRNYGGTKGDAGPGAPGRAQGFWGKGRRKTNKKNKIKWRWGGGGGAASEIRESKNE